MQLGIVSRDGTIGDDWSSDPDEKAKQVQKQERLVSEMCDILDQFDEWDLE